MTRDEVAAALRANNKTRVKITFADGVIQSVDIAQVDDEGFLHSGADGLEPMGYWTRFESVSAIEVDRA